MRARALTVPDLSRLSGVPESSIYKYLKGRTDAPRGDILERLARALQRTAVELRYGIEPDPLPQLKRIPLLSMNELGTVENMRGVLTNWQGPTVYVPAFPSSEFTFSAEVKDASCIPKIEPGDLIVVDIDAEPEPGDFVVAYVAALSKSVCRRFRAMDHSSKMSFQLMATNGDYPTISINSAEEGQIIGRVRKVVKDV